MACNCTPGRGRRAPWLGLLLLGIAALLASPAWAYRPALEPQIRAHAGASYVAGPYGLGGMVGVDSRLTRLVHVDIGGTFSPRAVPEDWSLERDLDPVEYFRLRHSLYITPGLRLPLPQPQGFTLDVYLRGGVAVAWSVDLSPSTGGDPPRRTEVDPAGLAGVDVVVQGEHLGVRGVVRGYGLRPFYNDGLDDVLFFTPQLGLEGIWLF